jgi:hypothetical protein
MVRPLEIRHPWGMRTVSEDPRLTFDDDVQESNECQAGGGGVRRDCRSLSSIIHRAPDARSGCATPIGAVQALGRVCQGHYA